MAKKDKINFKDYFKKDGYEVVRQTDVTDNPKMPSYIVLAYGGQCKVVPDGQYVTWLVNKRETETEFSRNYGHYFTTGPQFSKERCLKMASKDFQRRVKDARQFER